MAYLNDIYIQIASESYSRSTNVTSHPVESGVDITDHTKLEPYGVNLQGWIISDTYDRADASRRLGKLVALQEKGNIVEYTGRTATGKKVIITSLNHDHTKDIANGTAISMSLKFVKIVESPWRNIPKKQVSQLKPVTKDGTKKAVTVKTQSTETYHTVKRGDTYWGLSKTYGTSIANLRSWNKYSDNSIPIGAKLRVR